MLHRVSGQPGQGARDGLGITGGQEDLQDSRGRDRREEVLQVEAHQQLLAGVRFHEIADRAARPEAPRRFVRRDGVEDFPQRLPLGEFEQRLRALDQAEAAALRFRLPLVAVVLCLAAGNQPAEIVRMQPQDVGKVSQGGDFRNLPLPRSTRGWSHLLDDTADGNSAFPLRPCFGEGFVTADSVRHLAHGGPRGFAEFEAQISGQRHQPARLSQVADQRLRPCEEFLAILHRPGREGGGQAADVMGLRGHREETNAERPRAPTRPVRRGRSHAEA